MNAILINYPNNDNKFICNICQCSIEQNKIIGLKCNIKKHVFCYDCIFDWYKEINNNIKSYTFHNNYNIIKMCPICRKNGGFLPNLNYNTHPSIKKIHYNINHKSDIIQTCGVKLNNNKDYCICVGKKIYNNMCKKHYENYKKNELINKILNQNNDINENNNSKIEIHNNNIILQNYYKKFKINDLNKLINIKNNIDENNIDENNIDNNNEKNNFILEKYYNKFKIIDLKNFINEKNINYYNNDKKLKKKDLINILINYKT